MSGVAVTEMPTARLLEHLRPSAGTMIGSRGPYTLHLLKDGRLHTGAVLVMQNAYGGPTGMCHYEIDAEDAARIGPALLNFAKRRMRDNPAELTVAGFRRATNLGPV